ncbi:MAG: glycosyltransferase [Bacteroidetes bacterium]|nr:glycosyltransferase [Bacteroidota bacterium]
MENKDKVSIIVPAYNEEEVIKYSLDRLISLGFHNKYELIYINDGSTDGTGNIIKDYPVKLINHNSNKGYGAALKTGIRKATGKKIIILDSDGQHDPKYIERLINMLDEHDLVIGERSSDSFQVKRRQGGKKLIRIVGEYLVEQKLPDFNSGFRGFKRELIVNMLHLMPNGFSFSTTSTLTFIKEGYSIGTFPIVAEERRGRKSNLKFMKDGTKTMLLIFRIILLFNPLKVFFPASIFFTVIGLVFGIYGYIVASRFSNSAIILTTLGMFLFFIGLISDQISMLNRKSN